MSQYGILKVAGSTPTIPTSFITDDGTVVAEDNEVIFEGGSTSDDNDNGIRVIKDPVIDNKALFQLTNRLHGQTQTTDATPTTIVTYDASSPGTYVFELKSAAINTTDDLSGGFSIFATVRSNGTDTFLIDTPDRIINQEGAMASSDFNISVGGVGNTNVNFQVTGLATKTIEWCVVGEFCLIAEAV